MLRMGRLQPAEQSDTWALLDRQLDQLLATVEDVSELMRLDAGSFSFRPERADLRDMFDLLVGRGELERELAKTGVSLLAESCPDPVCAMHDRRRLTTVLEFLIVRYSRLVPKDGTVRLALRRDGSAAVWTLQGAATPLTHDGELRVVIGESCALDDCQGRALVVREVARMHAIKFRMLDLDAGLEFSLPLEA